MERLENGANLGPYRILNQIGEGGMARVYKAFQANMERYVALKVLPSHYAGDPQFVKRFIREARTIARLEHKNILPVYDFGEYNGITYLVMRYLEGGTLKDVLARGRLSLHDILEIMSQICPAMDYAHRNGVIHRDIKPSNIMIDSEGDAYLTDFGIAKVIGKSGDLTATGVAIGTPAYMAPEQAIGEKVDARADLYALGVVLYEMVVGRVPFQADTPMAVLLAHVHDPLPLPSQVDPNLPEAIEKVIIKALAKNPDDRYASASALLQGLRQAVAAATPESLQTTLVNLISEIKASRSEAETALQESKRAEISDPRLLEKLEQLYIDGLSAYWIQDWEKAQARLQEVVNFDSQYKDAAVRLADIQKQRRLADLRHKIQQAIELNHWQAAQDALRDVLAVLPDDPLASQQFKLVKQKLELEGYYNQAEQLFEAAQWQAVLKIFEHIHTLESDYPDPENLQAQAQKALDEQLRLEKIKQTYQSGLQALDKGDWKQAQKLFSQVKTQQPAYGDAEQLLARAMQELTRTRQKPPEDKKPAEGKIPAGKRLPLRPWIALVGLVLVVGVVAVIVYLSRLQGEGRPSAEASATTSEKAAVAPTSTPEKPAPTATRTSPPQPSPTSRSDQAMAVPGMFDDFSASNGNIDPDRWQVAPECELFADPDGLVVDGKLRLQNSANNQGQNCTLWALAGQRIAGESLGGLAAQLYLKPVRGSEMTKLNLTLLTDVEDGHSFEAICGVQTIPGEMRPDRPLVAYFHIMEFQKGREPIEHFYHDEFIEPLVLHDVQEQIDPGLMTFRCQVDDLVLGAWIPEDPQVFQQSEFARYINMETYPGVVSLATVDDVRLPGPQWNPPAECGHTYGWTALYWDNADLLGAPRICRDEESLSHFWGLDRPAPEIPNNWFSARYTRELDMPSGRYTFRLSGDDGVRMWLDDKILIDEWQDQEFTDFYAEMDVPAGLHTLQVEFFEHAGEAFLDLVINRNEQPFLEGLSSCLPPPPGLIGWWAGDGDTTNEIPGPAGELRFDASFAPGIVDQAFRFNPQRRPSNQADFIQVPPEAGLEYYAFTIESWVYLDPELFTPDLEEMFVESGRFTFMKGMFGDLVFRVHLNGEFTEPMGSPEPLPRGEWLHVAGVYDGGSVRLYLNGQEVASREVAGEPSARGDMPDMWISNPNIPLYGMLDEVSLYDRPLSPGEIHWLYNIREYGKCKR